MMNCHEATQLFSESQDRTLSRVERLRLNIHLVICKACRQFGQHSESLREITRRYIDKDDSS